MTASIERLVDNAPFYMALVDRDTHLRALSQVWRESLELTAPLAELSMQTLLRQGDCGLAQEKFHEVLATGRAVRGQPVTCTRDATAHGVLTLWRTPDESGVVMLMQPDGELARARQQFAQLQQTQELILDAAGEGIYGLDDEGRVLFANQASTDILGWSFAECLGRAAHELYGSECPESKPHDRDEKLCPIVAALRTGTTTRVDRETFWHADGRGIPVEYTSTPILKDGRPRGAVVVFRDISERVQMQEAQQAAYQEIAQLKEQLQLERDYLRDEIKVTAQFGEIIGCSPALQRVLQQVEAVAQTDASVLVLGESGVGKELIARAIHQNSVRAERPLVKVNCASIPKELFESEFFGHVQGAFTGAHQDRVGRMQLADGGTLFLDEVGEIPLALQSKLLRVLQEREFERVGDHLTIQADVRIVAATNRDLQAEVQAGRFREDLYYRLSVFPVDIPPLRERTEDILPLTQHLLDAICRSQGRSTLTLSRQQADRLQQHDWPGNVRELRNVLERAVILSQGTRLRLDLAMPDLDTRQAADSQATPAAMTATADAIAASFVTDAEFRQYEKANLTAALHQSQWRISGPGGAAELLGLKPSTLSYRIKTLGIAKP